MEGDKKRTKDDTWKSDELKKHLKVSRSGSQSEDRRHRQRKSQDGDSTDTEDYKGVFQKDQDKHRGKEKLRYKSSERQSDERREKGREKDHPRENREKDHPGERAREKNLVTDDKHISRKGRERHSGKERERKHHKVDPDQTLVEDTVDAYVERSSEHYRRRSSKDHADHPKAKGEEREKKHSDRKNGEGRIISGEISTKQQEEQDRKRRSQKEHEPDKEGSRGQREKEKHKERREHREKKEDNRKKEHELSAAEEKEKLLKLRTLASVRDAEERHLSRKHKEQSQRESGHHRESRERQQQKESDEKKRDHKYSEYRSQRKSSRHDDDADHPHERGAKEKVKKHGKRERDNLKEEHHKVDEPSSVEPRRKSQANEEKENTLQKSASHPDADYDYPVNYEDDFEDYEDDFDDIDDEDDEDENEYSQEQEKEKVDTEENVRRAQTVKNAEIEEIQRAINAENEMIETFLPKQTQNKFVPKELEMKHEKKSRKERQDLSAQSIVSGKFIDFQTAKRRQNVREIASQQKKRSLELLRLIDLDFSVSICLLDLPSVNEYDMYIRNFGKINTKQAYVQWNEDNLDRDVQTEEVETQEKWTQHPGETSHVSGGPRISSDVSALTPKVDSQRLANFLQSACQVIEVLLEEDQVATQPRRNLRSRPSSLSISDRCFQLNTDLPFLNGRKLSHLHISQAQRQALLSVHKLPETSSDTMLDSKYIICVWNVWQPSSPQKLLYCESQVTCCCFSPSKAILVFAGTIDGSVLVWDLREDSRMHHPLTFSGTEWLFRSPTFSTDGVFTSVNHTCPVLTVEPVSTSVFKEQNCGLSYLASPEEMLGLSFQIASMDENGTLSLWVVVELQKGDLAGSQNDLGLIPGGKIKLVHSSTVQLNCSFPTKDAMFQGVPQTLKIKFLPSNPNHFVVGTDLALVSHGTRHDLKVPPKWFKPQQGEPRSTRVNAIDFSPFGKPIFLVGCSDGSIRLHQMTSELPLMQWNNSTAGQPIIALQWALTRPAVFFVLDAASVVYIWDLLENDLSPVAKQPIWSDKVITMAVLGEPEKPSGLLGIALAKESGIIDIKYVKKKWAQPQPEESEKLNLLLQQAL